MIKHILFTIFFMLLLIAGCTSEAPQLSPISKINADFQTGSGTSFPGGLLVIGVRQDANEKVSFAFPDGNPTPIIMDRGDWIFYSFGYSGIENVADLRPGKFAGLVECGLASVSIRGGERKAINLNLNSDGCSGKLSRDTKLQKVYVDTCATTSFFTNTAPYMFTPQALSTGNVCGNTPEDQNSNIRYYKIFAVNLNAGVATESFSSPCLDEISLGSYPRNIPGDIAPLKIKIYRSLASCEGDNVAHNTFYYPNGILTGNTSDFDSFLAENYTPGFSRLYLPEAHTKKYHSPFLNNIPRFICTTPDCFVSPLTGGRTLAVDWSKPAKDQLIVPDIKGSYTCDDFSHYSNKFGFSDCKIKNNSLYATVRRNTLACHDTPPFPTTFNDLNERNGYIYVLYEMNSTTFVSVMSAEGQNLAVVNIGADLNYTSVTGSDSGDFYVGNPSLDTVSHYKKTGSTWAHYTDYSILDPGIIEVTHDGRYLMYSGLNSYRINTFDTTGLTLGYTMPSDTPMYIQKLQYVNGKLYAHIGVDIINDPSSLYRYDVENGALNYEADLSGTGTNVSWHINNGILNYLTPGYNIGTLNNYENAADYLQLGPINGPSQSFVRMVDDFVVVNNTAYGIQKDWSDLVTLQWVGGLFVQPTVVANECSDTFSVKLGSEVVASHTIVSKLTPDDTEMALRIFEAGDKLIGKKSADNKSYFQSLNEEQSRNTNGGILSLPQRLLGPHGVGGMLAEYADCDAVKTAANLMPIIKSVGVTDPYRGYQSFSIRVTPNSDVIPKFSCNDGIFNDATCTNQYDLKVKVASTGLLENETYIIKLQCSSLVGQVDYRNTNRDVSWKQQVYWNTTLSTKSRVDSYKIVKSDDHDIFETSLAFSTGSFIRARSARKDFWTDYNTATIWDYQNDFGTTYHYARRIHLGGIGSATPGAAGEYATYRNEADFTGNGDYCLDVTESNPATASVGLCMFDNVLPDRVKPSTLSLTAIENEFSFDTNFSSFP